MTGFEGGEDLGPGAGGVGQEIDGVHENQHELNHLHLGQVLLPPQDLLSSQCCQSVVHVPVQRERADDHIKIQSLMKN